MTPTLTPTQKKALIEVAAPAAKQAEKQTGSPAALALAQWWLESNAGEAIWGNNCFGLKEFPGCYGRQLLRTHERFTDAQAAAFLALAEGRTCVLDPPSQAYDKEGKRLYACRDYFATFPTLAAAFAYHGHLLTIGPYAPGWQQYQKDHDLDKYVHAIAPHYATAKDYAAAVLLRIHHPDVIAALA